MKIIKIHTLAKPLSRTMVTNFFSQLPINLGQLSDHAYG